MHGRPTRHAPTAIKSHTCRTAVLRAVLVCVAIGASAPVLAQGFPWLFGEPEKKPVPREPVYRAPPATSPQPAPQPAPIAGNGTGRSAICLQLEQRLVQESARGNQSRDQLPKLEGDIRATERALQQSQSQIDRQECYEYFLFSKSLKNTRQCRDLATQVETNRRKLSELDAQRQQIVASAGRSYQDDIIRELARNNCGSSYAQEARKRDGAGPFSSIWQDEEGGGPGGNTGYGNLPFATYRTVCVRLCDGYYFPISYSTLPNHFQRDADLCQQKCAAPVELYYHQNPGGAIEQAAAAKTQEPYTKLKTAFRYRKEFVPGCSCKQAEYVPQTQIPGAAPGLSDKRAGVGATTTTGSVAVGKDAWRAEARPSEE